MRPSPHYRPLLALLLALLVLPVATGRTRTTHRQLSTESLPVETLPVTATDSVAGVHAGDVTLRGFGKRASDTRESFFVVNNMTHRISAVRLLLRYTLAGDGTMLHEREVKVPVSLQPGQSQLVTVPSWDKQRQFYYYAGPRPRKSATPFKVSFRLLGYDIPVGQ